MKRLVRPSLARRILITTMLSFLFGFIVLAAFSFYQVFRQQDGILEAQLKTFATSLSQALANYETDEQVRFAADAAQKITNAQSQLSKQFGKIYIQVWTHDEQRVYTSIKLPEHRPEGLKSARFDWDGQHYDVITVASPKYVIDVLGSFSTQSMHELFKVVLSDLLIKMAIAFPLFFLPIWFAVHSGLKPLGRLSDSLRTRHVDDLTPFASDMRYAELHPIVHAINDLMVRLKHKIRQEQAFTHDAAHELQTPLAVIANQTHILATAKTQDERIEAHQNAEHAIARAGHLVRQMVALARLDSERQDDVKTLDAAAEIRKILASLVPIAQDKSIELTLESPDSIALHGSVNALHSIVTNLIDNALRYTGEGGHVQVEITSDNGMLTLSVRDDGPGISVTDRERVFDRYYRVAGTGVSGSGLGLAIVKQAVTRMRGNIRLEDGVTGKGCTFVVELPTG